MTARLRGVRDADVVVIGAGAAGLSVALGLAGRSVDLLAKGPLARTGNSPLAQGGVAAAVGPDDTPALHAADTLAVGGAVGDPEAVARLTTEGPQRLTELIELGACFDRDVSGELDLAREALAEIDEIEQRMPAGARELRSLVTVGRLIARAALARSESRGAHFRLDVPDADAAWRGRLVLGRIGDRERVGFDPASLPTGAREEVSA